MNCIVAKKKRIIFESCVFDSSFNLFHVYKEKGVFRGGDYYRCDISPLFQYSIYNDYSSDFTTYKLNAWIYVGNADFRRCVFQNYSGGLPILNMQNGSIFGSRFINCEKQNWSGSTYGGRESNVTFTYLLKVANGSVSSTSFEKCTNRVDIKGNNATGCFLLADNTNITNCKFTKCQNWVGGDYGSYARNYSFFVYLKKVSTVKCCSFEKISCIAKDDSDKYVEPYAIALYKFKTDKIESFNQNNSFDRCDCPCYKNYKSQGNEFIGVTDREIE